MSSARSEIQKLGMERETSEKQLMYLTDLSTQFQRMVTFSVDAKYGSSAIFDDPELRLATLVTARNITFSDDMSQRGQEYRFSASESQQAEEELPPALKWNQDEIFAANNEAVFDIRKHADCIDIADLLHAPKSLFVANGKPIAYWLREMTESSRGFELGTFGPSILANTMKVQTIKWEAICLAISAILQRLFTTLLTESCNQSALMFKSNQNCFLS